MAGLIYSAGGSENFERVSESHLGSCAVGIIPLTAQTFLLTLRFSVRPGSKARRIGRRFAKNSFSELRFSI